MDDVAPSIRVVSGLQFVNIYLRALTRHLVLVTPKHIPELPWKDSRLWQSTSETIIERLCEGASWGFIFAVKESIGM